MKSELDFAFSAFDVESTTEGIRIAILEVAFWKRAGALLAFHVHEENGHWVVSGDLLWFCFFTFKRD